MADDTEVTIVITWVFTWLAEALMALRLIMRKLRKQDFNISDYITVAAMAFLIIRLAMVHVVLIWGTNNIQADFRDSHKFTAQEIYQREIGSKLTLAVRAVYNNYAWLQKGVVMFLYKRMFHALPWMDRPMKIYWFILFATFVVAQVTLFTECHPFYLYWQVLPGPGVCVEALTQLLVLGLVTILTDVMLIVLPMPILFRVKRSFKEKLQLVGLFSIGFILVAMTIARLDENYSSGALQVNRTIWASVEAFASAFVANMPTLYTLRRRSNTSNGTMMSRSSTRPDSEEERGIKVTRSVELDVQYESPTFPKRAVMSDGGDSWDKQSSEEELIQTSVQYD